MSVAVSTYNAPTFVELVPEDLDVRVFRHAVDSTSGPVPCWSYVTDGLRRYGQKDIVFTLRRMPGEADGAFPRDPFDLFLLLRQQARDGKVVEAGGYSRFARPGGFLGKEGPVGMAYVPASPLKGVNYPDRPLAAYFVSADELESVRAHGNYRLLTLLGFRSNFFPFPPWSERGRRSLLGPKDVKASLLGQVAVATTRGLTARRQRNQLHLYVHDERYLQHLEKRLAQVPPGPIVLLTDPDPEAKARLVWKPGMAVETVAVDNRPEAVLTGGFVAFLPSTAAEEGAHVCEDGFVIKLRPATWQKVRDALLDNDDLVVPAQGGAMKVVCGLTTEVEPVRAAGGHPLMPDELFRERITPEEYSWFDRRIGHIVEDHFGDQPAGEGEALTVFCAIRPGQVARYWLESRPEEMPAGSRTLLLRRLNALKPPPVKAPVAWGTRFDLWGGTGDPSHFVPQPAEWGVAFPPHEPPPAPDLLLDRVWPA
ncbi:MAG: hypothetical protein K1X57_13880 [Gemmataceae bacterium]|nr:hypothetical protein [Gemmataceae bacterium]